MRPSTTDFRNALQSQKRIAYYSAVLVSISTFLSACAIIDSYEDRINAWQSARNQAFAIRNSTGEGAERYYLQAVHEAEKLGAGDLHLAISLNELGEFYRGHKRYAESASAFQRAAAICKASQNIPAEVDSVRSPELVKSISGLARVSQNQGDYEAAQRLFKQSIDLAMVCNTTASERQRISEDYSASKEHKDAIDTSLPTENTFLPSSTLNVRASELLWDSNQPLAKRCSEADKLAQQSLIVAKAHGQTANQYLALDILGRSAGMQGLSGKAIEHDLASLDLQKKSRALHFNHSNLAKTYQHLAEMEALSERWNDAETYLQLEQRELALVKNRKKTLCIARQVWQQMGDHYCLEHKFTQGELCYRKAVASQRQSAEAGSIEQAKTLLCLANSLMWQNKNREAEQFYNEAFSIWKRSGKQNSPDYASLLYYIAYNLGREGKHVASESIFRETLKYYEAKKRLPLSKYADTLFRLGFEVSCQGNHKEANLLYKRALSACAETKEPGFGPRSFEYGVILQSQAANCQGAGQRSEAIRLYKQAIEVFESHTTAAKSPELSSCQQEYKRLLQAGD